MTLKRHLPNLLTLGNLLCGTIAVIFALKNDFEVTFMLVLLGIVFDFFDGFVARLLGVQAELGKQLDSLADMVTSGVVPGIVMYQLFIASIQTDAVGYFGFNFATPTGSYLPYVGLLLTLAACYRLAKFNIDTRQTDSFIGLPTPAMSLFVVSLPLLALLESSFLAMLVLEPAFLLVVTLLFSYLMNAELPLFAFKFKSYGFKENTLRYLFILVSVVLILCCKIVAVPLIILLYVLTSAIKHGLKK